MYTPLPHDKLIKRLCNVIDFVFEGRNRTHICISKNTIVYWGKKSKDNIAFSKSTLTTSLMVENSLLIQKIGIPMGIDPALFWANLFSYIYENEYMSELVSNDEVKARHFHANKRFIDDLGTLNDRGVFNDVYKGIYLPELQLKIELSDTYALFLNLDITVKDGLFIYKLFDKRDAFPFFIVCTPYIDSNISKSIFYSVHLGEYLRIARSCLLYKDFHGKAMESWNCLTE